MQIRPIEARDYPAVVALSRPIVHAGETYALPRDMDDGALLDYWVAPDKVTFVCELDGVVAVGELDQPGWVFADLDLALVADLRADGGVLNLRHWAEQPGAAPLPPVEFVDLR